MRDHATKFFLGYLKGSISTDGLQHISTNSSVVVEVVVVGVAPSDAEVEGAVVRGGAVVGGGAAPSSKASNNWWNRGIGTAESSRFFVLRRWKGFLHEEVVAMTDDEDDDEDVDIFFVVRSARAQKLEGAPRYTR